MPIWLQILLGVWTPISATVIGWLLLRGEKRNERQQNHVTLTADALAKQHIADVDAEQRFINNLMARVVYLEEQERQTILKRETRDAQMQELYTANARLGMQVEALKYELAGKINAAVSKIEQSAASALIEAGKKGGD